MDVRGSNKYFKKGTWSPDEDEMLLKLVEQQSLRATQDNCDGCSSPSSVGSGVGAIKLDWKLVSLGLKTRSGKQCRERWVNHLNPELVKSKWTAEEDAKLLKLGVVYSKRWAQIARELPGRSQNQVKIRWNSLNHIKNKSRKRKSPGRRSSVGTKRACRNKSVAEKSLQASFAKQEFPDVSPELVLTTSEMPMDNGSFLPELSAPLRLPDYDRQWNCYGCTPPVAPFRPINPAYHANGYYNEDDVVEEQILSLLAPL